MKTKTAIILACKIFGGQTALAKALDVHFSLPHRWKVGYQQVPFERCIQIEKLTDRRVRCENLRPDIDWKYLKER